MNTDRRENHRATNESPTAPHNRTPGDDLEARGADSEPNANVEARGASSSLGDNIDSSAPSTNIDTHSANSAPGNKVDAHSANSAPGNDIGVSGKADSTPSTDREERGAANAHVNTSGDSANSDHAGPAAGTRDAGAAIPIDGQVAAPTSAQNRNTDTGSRTEAGPSTAPAEATSAPDQSATHSTSPDAATPNGKPAAPHDEPIPLFTEAEIERLRTEWRTVQGSFIDNPREAVSRADNLVANTIDHLTAAYSEHRRGLTTRWSRDPDTEDLRNTLRAYRTFFNQLLP
ncbi:hypothetical protein [Nocardia bhagyanarayanae]|uniref:Uncharacterized protein n=1 Tax=Nocardia bhagyanarayanae TaxID=1215925 RepID=A0A543FA69_9NOCA|nr:hypothetical protein [Nocardia bhagyanarayanae]TQM30714.1 hypothetical protein FB390_2350 [Nocardia bhagyanarayanae]